jgi:transposase InsO family protein
VQSSQGQCERILAWKRRKPSPKELENLRIVKVMLEIHEKNYKCYGGVKMKKTLEKKVFTIGLGRVYRLMRHHGIYTVHRFKHRPNAKEHSEMQFSESTLERQFNPEAPDWVWVGDITYIKTKEGWAYLAVVLDLFNREVVGWSMSRNPDTELVIRALAHALARRSGPKGILFHSDRDCQYSSKRFQRYLEENGLSSSMSRKGNPFDNSCCESFFATLKKECIYFKRYANLGNADTSVFEYIEIFYNRKRMHSTLGYISPKQFLDNYLRGKAA